MGHLGVSRYSEYLDCNILNTLIASLNISYQVVLYEYLGEEYPEVLGSILGALKAIVNVIGMTKMTPPIKDLLPRLTPILKNRYNRVSSTKGLAHSCTFFRHEKVQENCIDLVGRIADRGELPLTHKTII